MILDMPKFDDVVSTMVREENTNRIHQQMLADKCGTVLKRRELLSKRRDAIASGLLI